MLRASAGDGELLESKTFSCALERCAKSCEPAGRFSRSRWSRQELDSCHVGQPSLSMPLVSMVSYAIIHRHGPARYIETAKAAGFSGAIVPDLLVEESAPFAILCREHDFNLVQLVTPTTPQDRALKIAEQSSGFLYFVSVTGITGERTQLPDGLVDRVGWLRERTKLPICIGFGISKPEHVRLLSPVCDGLIVGSAIVRCLEKAHESEANAIASAAELVSSLLAALES